MRKSRFPSCPVSYVDCSGIPRRNPVLAYAVVVFVEPVFQAANSWDAGLQAWLVFGNVPLISAAQIFLFVRHGFAAMIALRLVFYLFWHLIRGSIRHFLLF